MVFKKVLFICSIYFRPTFLLWVAQFGFTERSFASPLSSLGYKRGVNGIPNYLLKQSDKHAGRYEICDSLNPIQEKENRLFIWIMKTSLHVSSLACANIACTSAADLTSLCFVFASLLFCRFLSSERGEPIVDSFCWIILQCSCVVGNCHST